MSKKALSKVFNDTLTFCNFVLHVFLVVNLCEMLESLNADCKPHTFAFAFQYLGKSHNLWHKACLMLEQMAFDNGLSTQLVRTSRVPNASSLSANQIANLSAAAEYDFEGSGAGGGSGGAQGMTAQQETLDCLCSLYTLLKEEDMLAGLWQKRANSPDTTKAMAYEQHGFYEQAQGIYEMVSTAVSS